MGEATAFVLYECLRLFLRLCVTLHVRRHFFMHLYDVQGGMHTFDSVCLSLCPRLLFTAH